MDKIVAGLIYDVNLTDRVIYIKKRKQVYAFYLQRSLVKQFGKYLEKGVYVTFKSKEESQLIKGKRVYVIDHFIRIAFNRKVKQEVFYCVEVIKQGIRDLVNNLGNRMFLDIEMTMQNFNQRSKFIQEVIQVGFVLEDKDGNILEYANIYIKPKRYPTINERTKNFLNVTQEDVDNGLEPREFAKIFNQMMTKYDPTIIVWGANDYLGLKSLYEVNALKGFVEKDRFLDLLKIHKNYFNLKDDLGLFKALEMYGQSEEDASQMHNALEDATATRVIFHEFKKLIND